MKAQEKLSVLQQAAALASIRTAKLRHVGLAPVHDGKTSPVVVYPIDPTENLTDVFDDAMEAATDYWPDCTDWNILSSDNIDESDSIPPDFVLMHSPEVTGAFSSH